MNENSLELLALTANQVASRLGLTEKEPLSLTVGSRGGFSDACDCLLLKGDNLKWMLNLLAEKSTTVDFCYIDPPYNTGQEFIYSDNRKTSDHPIWGKHSGWMAFMLPRLVAVHMLLAKTGVIAISIDDYEYANLKILMDSIFGATSYMATLVVCRSKNGKGSKPNVAVNHEYILLYGKTSKASIKGLHEDEGALYNKTDEFGHYKIDGLFRKKGDASLRSDRPSMYYPLYYSQDGRVFTERSMDGLSVALPVDSKGIERRWLWGVEKAKLDSWKLYASKSGVIYVKNYKSADKRVKLRSMLDSPYYLTDRATREVKYIYGEKVFETPKPVALIRDLIDCCAPSNALVLDFFAGTGTTAEAAWDLNACDNGTRKVILIEQDISIDDGHIAKKYGFQCIADITEFRLKAIQARHSRYQYSGIADLKIN